MPASEPISIGGVSHTTVSSGNLNSTSRIDADTLKHQQAMKTLGPTLGGALKGFCPFSHGAATHLHAQQQPAPA